MTFWPLGPLPPVTHQEPPRNSQPHIWKSPVTVEVAMAPTESQGSSLGRRHKGAPVGVVEDAVTGFERVKGIAIGSVERLHGQGIRGEDHLGMEQGQIQDGGTVVEERARW